MRCLGCRSVFVIDGRQWQFLFGARQLLKECFAGMSTIDLAEEEGGRKGIQFLSGKEKC